jgi:hypothetical protein
MRKTPGAQKAYKFFCEAEKSSRVFTLEEVSRATGWKLSTVKGYRSKKWHRFVKRADGGYTSQEVTSLSEDAFIRLHAQKISLGQDILRPRYGPKIDEQIDKSREAALLAIQIYNNPLVSFRTYGYIIQMVIAHTSLFHAIFERDEVEYWYKNDDGSPEIVDGDYMYWELIECVRNFYEGETTAETENIRFFVQLRNKIEHRFIPRLDMTVSGYCQALLLNYERLLVTEFGNYFGLGQDLALALQLSEYSQEQLRVIRRVQSQNFRDIREYITEFCRPLSDEIIQSDRFCFRAFLIPKIGNHAKSSDIAIEFVKYDPTSIKDMENYEKQIALIRMKQVPVADQGMLKPSDVVRAVKERTGLEFSMYHHTNAWKKYGVRGYTADS